MSEEVNKMKMCFLCKQSEEHPYPSEKAHSFEQHFVLGMHWKPTKGHPQFETHNRMMSLFSNTDGV